MSLCCKTFACQVDPTENYTLYNFQLRSIVASHPPNLSENFHHIDVFRGGLKKQLFFEMSIFVQFWNHERRFRFPTNIPSQDGVTCMYVACFYLRIPVLK